MSKGRWKEWENEFLRANYVVLTDKEIAEKLGRKPDGVYRKRRSLGLSKRNGRPTDDERHQAPPTEYSLSKLPKEERLKFYKTHFESNWRYKHLKRVLLPQELDYYRHRYIECIDAMDSLNYIEEDLVHNMVMCDIQVMRIQEQIKVELEEFKNADKDSDNWKLPNQALYKDLNDAEKKYMEFQKQLNITRQQRLKENREEDITITSVVENLLDKKKRAGVDKLAGELDYFKKRAATDMSKMDFLLGARDLFNEKK